MPNKIAIGFSDMFSELETDILMSRKITNCHKSDPKRMIRMTQAEWPEMKHLKNFRVGRPFSHTKVTEVSRKTVQLLLQKRKLKIGFLSLIEKTKRCISHNRVCVKTILADISSRELFSQNWKQDEGKYKTYIQVGIALSNLTILFNQLRASNSRLFMADTNHFSLLLKMFLKICTGSSCLSGVSMDTLVW